MQQRNAAVLAVLGFGLASLCVFAAEPPASAAVPARPALLPVTIHIAAGTLKGAGVNGVAAFKNIPYAAPPVGDLRWHAPQPPAAWQGVRDATAFGNDCMQNRMAWDTTASQQPLSEDCLNLNVWTPAPLKAGRNAPVMVWIHGGGFVSGSATAEIMDGSALARRGVVVVSFNYRLGRFGFFAHPALTAEAGAGPTGNWGFMDQLAALHWVQKNIAAFGGNPKNVTIFGESAGGDSVNNLMLSPLAKGLFARAIVESGGGRTPWPKLHEDQPSLPSAEARGLAFAKSANAGDDVKSLRAIPAATVLGEVNILSKQSDTYSDPMIDGKLIVENVQDGFKAGHQVKVPYLVGSNSNELGILPPFILTPLNADLTAKLGADAQNVLAAYGSQDDYDQRLSTDMIFTEPARFLARAAAAAGQPVYLFRFAYVTESKRATVNGAPHASDVPYVFGNLEATGDPISVADQDAARRLGDNWVAFAKTGVPAADEPVWPKYNAKDNTLMEFSIDGPRLGRASGAGLDALAAHYEHPATEVAAAPSAATPLPAAPPSGPSTGPSDPACAALRDFRLDGGRIDSVASTLANQTYDIGFPGVPPLPFGAPFCRVKATLQPTPDSQIQVEVWLPPIGSWNSKLLGVGSGGYAGNFFGQYLGMHAGLMKGYAVAATDTGHYDDQHGWAVGAEWAAGHVEKIRDFGWRSEHLTAVAAKALVNAYYAHPQRRAYFQGCSNGGREALMEAQRFPDDYDGIVAGAPANHWTQLMASFAWDTRVRMALPEHALPAPKLAVLQAAVLKKCDAEDGVKDGLLQDPRECDFDPGAVQCKGADREDCLTAPQVDAVRNIYRGVRGGFGKPSVPGYSPGAETADWDKWITGAAPDQTRFADEFIRHMIYGNADWTRVPLKEGFDPAGPAASAQIATLAGELDSTDPDLSAFAKHGGKLLLYHGWADAAIPPLMSVDYAEKVRDRMGEKTDGFFRFYLLPGMGHCMGGPGPNTFEPLDALDQWVDKSQAPAALTASKFAIDYAKLIGLPTGEPLRTRPLCPYPQVAQYQGSGSIDQAENFSCGRAK